MKIKILKKNNKALYAKRGRGFYGRVFVLGVDDGHIVLQNARKAPRTTAVLTYCDVDLFASANEKETVIDAVQRHYLKNTTTSCLLSKVQYLCRDLRSQRVFTNSNWPRLENSKK